MSVCCGCCECFFKLREPIPTSIECSHVCEIIRVKIVAENLSDHLALFTPNCTWVQKKKKKKKWTSVQLLLPVLERSEVLVSVSAIQI